MLDDLPDRWGTDMKRVQNYAESGKLSCSIFLRKSKVELGTFKKQKNGDEVFYTESCVFVKGFVGLMAEDCHWVFRYGKTHASSFYSLKKPEYHMQLIGDNASIPIELPDIAIRRCELLAFEKEHGLSPIPGSESAESLLCPEQSVIPLMYADSRDNGFFYSMDYRLVVIRGHEFALGEMQAKVIKQLHQASFMANTWLNGKETLYDAGSSSHHMINLFRRHKEWRELIESNSRGRYRLNIFSG